MSNRTELGRLEKRRERKRDFRGRKRDFRGNFRGRKDTFRGEKEGEKKRLLGAFGGFEK